jgi:Luciferase-like monooxygenase
MMVTAYGDDERQRRGRQVGVGRGGPRVPGRGKGELRLIRHNFCVFPIAHRRLSPSLHRVARRAVSIRYARREDWCRVSSTDDRHGPRLMSERRPPSEPPQGVLLRRVCVACQFRRVDVLYRLCDLGGRTSPKHSRERGFESIWAPEHSHISASRKTPFPGGGDLPKRYYDAMDPFVSLTAAAVATTKLKVGTGVCLAQQRDPIQTAKLVASIV